MGQANKYELEEEIRAKNRRKRFEVRYDVEKELRVSQLVRVQSLTASVAPWTRGR